MSGIASVDAAFARRRAIVQWGDSGVLEFALKPIDEIERPDRVLHWFGLSEGSYFIDLGATRLLAYAPSLGWSQYPEHAVARFHEDLLELLPAVLQAIPWDIVRVLRDGSVIQTQRALEAVWAASDIAPRATLDRAVSPLGYRKLDLGYLGSTAANIYIWRRAGDIVFEWDNRHIRFEGEKVWTAEQGTFALPVEDFLGRVNDFHARFMAQMQERIEGLARSRRLPAIGIDDLRREQIERAASLESAMRQAPHACDWGAVRFELSNLSA